MDEMQRPPRKRKKRKKKRYLLKFTILVALMIGGYIFLTSSLFDIHEITVSGSEHYTGSQIMKIANVKIGDNLFKISNRKVKKNLISDPYIKSVKVKRQLRNAYQITVKERSEQVAIKHNDKYLVMDLDGVILKKVDKEPALTLLEGLKVQTAKLGDPIEVDESAELVEILKLLNKTSKSDLYFKKIKLQPVTIRAFIYDKLICEGTPENIYNNLDKLDKVIQDLYQKGIERGVINIGGDDYISWKPEIKEK